MPSRPCAGARSRDRDGGRSPARWRAGVDHQVCVDDAAATAAAVIRAGGSVLAGPLDMSPASILTVVADPAGALLCAAQPVGRPGAQLVNEPGTWTMSALSTPEPSAVADFYRDVFGWERAQFGPMTLWRLPGYLGGEPSQPVPRDVIAVAQASDGAPRWNVDFRIADADAAARTARDAGGAVVAEPTERTRPVPASRSRRPRRRRVQREPTTPVTHRLGATTVASRKSASRR